MDGPVIVGEIGFEGVEVDEESQQNGREHHCLIHARAMLITAGARRPNWRCCTHHLAYNLLRLLLFLLLLLGHHRRFDPAYAAATPHRSHQFTELHQWRCDWRTPFDFSIRSFGDDSLRPLLLARLVLLESSASMPTCINIELDLNDDAEEEEGEKKLVL